MTKQPAAANHHEYKIKQEHRGATFDVYTPSGGYVGHAMTLWGARRIAKRRQRRDEAGYYKTRVWHV